ncbi:MAG TPA: metalloregulator ArsR/SmtB family transcription factor [Baekduia sp.]|nr:metalloregulator ArsR/SmtB family transcription factor [Baekduia sp.]
MDAAFTALAEPRRRAILSLVRSEPRAASEIAQEFPDITQQAVSLHLKVLHEAGLVDVRPQGRQRLYLLRPEGLRPVRELLDELWPASLQRLKAAVEAEMRDERD